MLYNPPHFTLYFGDAVTSILPEEHRDTADSASLLQRSSFATIRQALDLQTITFLHQVHGTDGMIITTENAKTLRPFGHDGDYMITNQKVALGILTADCLPLVIYDKKHHALALVHAGWRGSVNGITIKALEHMKQEFGTHVSDIQVVCGPAAKPCCYEVTPEFLAYLEPFTFAPTVIQKRNNQLFFDTLGFNTLLLQSHGIDKTQLDSKYSLCTLCTKNFCSSRRQKQKGEQQMRQMTIAVLK